MGKCTSAETRGVECNVRIGQPDATAGLNASAITRDRSAVDDDCTTWIRLNSRGVSRDDGARDHHSISGARSTPNRLFIILVFSISALFGPVAAIAIPAKVLLLMTELRTNSFVFPVVVWRRKCLEL